MAKIALGTHSEATQPDCVRAVLAEAVLTFLFVFAGVGAAMAAGMFLYIFVWRSNKHKLICHLESKQVVSYCFFTKKKSTNEKKQKRMNIDNQVIFDVII